jgi:hypothetical protein
MVASGCQSLSTVNGSRDQDSQPGSVRTDALTLQLDLPAEVPATAPVRLKMTLTNTSTRAVDVYLGGRPAHDFAIATPGGTQVWRWLEDQVVQQILELRRLKPGEQLDFEAQWPVKDARGNQVTPGRYLVTGMLSMDPPEKLQTTPMEILLE